MSSRNRFSLVQRRAARLTACVVLALLAIHVSVTAYDVSLKSESLKNLQAIGRACTEHFLAPDGVSEGRLQGLVELGAVSPDQTSDPRSGLPYRYASCAPSSTQIDAGRPVAFTALSDGPMARWPIRARGGGIFYVDGHAEWHEETEFRAILAVYGLTP